MNRTPLYYIYDDMVTLKEHYHELDDDERRQLKAHVALNAPDPIAVTMFTDIADDDWAHIYPPTPKAEPITTSQAIDTFLETYGHSSPEEDALLERLIFNPTPDYSSVLEAQAATEPQPADKEKDLTSSRIDSFMEAHAPTPSRGTKSDAQPHTTTDRHESLSPKTDTAHSKKNDTDSSTTKKSPTTSIKTRVTEPPAGTSLSESLAKIYIKQGRYERAYEIISDLNLKNPQKSIYFADQLRFLEKLMLIAKARANQQ